MSQPSTDRNLLFGILALQNDFISREQLIAAVTFWLADKSRPLDEILCAQNALAADEHELLLALLSKHLEKHDGDPEKSLAALSSVGSIRNNLKQLGKNAQLILSLTFSAGPLSEFSEVAVLEPENLGEALGGPEGLAAQEARVLLEQLGGKIQAQQPEEDQLHIALAFPRGF